MMHGVDLPERLNAAQVFVDTHIREGRGEKPAILCGDRTVTYRDLHEGVNRFGNAMRALGLRMEERVAILLHDTPEFAFAFFGAMKIGAVAIPMNTLLMPADYEYLLNDSRARVLVVDASLMGHVAPVRDKLKHLEHIVVAEDVPEMGTACSAADNPEPRSVTPAVKPVTPGCGHALLPKTGLATGVTTYNSGCVSLHDAMQKASADLDPVDTSKDDAAFWLYSSGTTGFPKGAIHLHHDMIVAADQYARKTLGLRESDVSFSIAKLFFAYGLGNGLYFSLRVGATTVLFPGRPLPDAVFGVIDKYQPTVFYSVPTSYAALLHAAEQNGRKSLGKVRVCVSAGEPLPKPIYEKWRDHFGVQILDGIGTTEILHIFISNRPGKAKPGSTGQIVSGYKARIVDDHGHDVPTDHIGSLMIQGDSIAAGYWNKHEQTKKTFHGEWINTGDKYKMDEDGFFWYAGRADDMMKVSGYAVWPTDIESVLQGHPAVLESGVAGIPDEEGLIKPRAYVVLKDGHAPTADLARELQEFVKKNTAPYKYPRSVEFVESLPKTATGKIKRYKLREMGIKSRDRS